MFTSAQKVEWKLFPVDFTVSGCELSYCMCCTRTVEYSRLTFLRNGMHSITGLTERVLFVGERFL